MTKKQEAQLRLSLSILVLLFLAYLAFQLISPVTDSNAIKAIGLAFGLAIALLINAMYFFKNIRHEKLKQLVIFLLTISAALMILTIGKPIVNQIKLVHLNLFLITVVLLAMNLMIYLSNRKKPD